MLELFPELEFSCEQSFKPDYDEEILCEGDELEDEYNLDDVKNFCHRHDREDCIKDQIVRQDEED